MQHLLRRLLARGRGIRVQPPETGEAPPVQYNGHSLAAADEIQPRAAPFVTDDAAISRAAVEIEALRDRIAGAIGTAKKHLSAADEEIAALRQRLDGAGSEIASLKVLAAAADRERAALQAGLAAAAGEAAALKQEAAARKGEAADWRAQLYKSERALIDELDRLAQRAIAAAAPNPHADAAAPFVSVVTPVYNRPELLAVAIKSVLAQSFVRWEQIVVDDGSTDDIAGAMQPFLADPRVRLVRQANSGECAARNRALRLARGEIVAYLDSDNFWYPDFLAGAADVFGADPDLEIAYGGIAYDWPNGDVRFYLLPFDRATLLRDNLADLNVIVHRRRAYERFGGFDETLNRAVEWDLMLRYTVDRPARQIPVMGARYRIVDKDRLSAMRPLHNNTFRIRSKWWTRPATPPRVLLAAPEFPQASESVHSAAACMRRLGAQVEVWAPAAGASLAAQEVPLHRGALADAIAAARPDLVHVEGLGLLDAEREPLAASGLPLTLRARGSETAPEALARVLALANLARAYLPGANGAADLRLRPIAPFFDTTQFAPAPEKDHRLILRAAPGLPHNDLRFLLELAKRLPEHRVVIAIARVSGHEGEIEALIAHRAEIGSPAELHIDLPRADLAGLFARPASMCTARFRPSRRRGRAPRVRSPSSRRWRPALTCLHATLRPSPRSSATMADSTAMPPRRPH